MPFTYSDLSVELPFTLTHPKPEPPAELIPVKDLDVSKAKKNGADQTVPVDLNLIEFETK